MCLFNWSHYPCSESSPDFYRLEYLFFLFWEYCEKLSLKYGFLEASLFSSWRSVFLVILTVCFLFSHFVVQICVDWRRLCYLRVSSFVKLVFAISKIPPFSCEELCGSWNRIWFWYLRLVARRFSPKMIWSKKSTKSALFIPVNPAQPGGATRGLFGHPPKCHIHMADSVNPKNLIDACLMSKIHPSLLKDKTTPYLRVSLLPEAWTEDGAYRISCIAWVG